MIIPDDARRQIMSLRDGVSERQFLDEMWKRRYLEHGKPRRSRKNWPIVRPTQVEERPAPALRVAR